MYILQAVVFCCLLLIEKIGPHGNHSDWQDINLWLNLSLVAIFGPLAVIIHEIGHLIAGKLAGIEIWGFHIGRGPVLVRFLRWGVDFEFHLLPTFGLVRGSSYHPRHWRRARFIWLAGGPLSNAIVGGSILFLERREFLDGAWMTHVMPWLALAISNLITMLQALLGARIQTTDLGPIKTDGRQLIDLVFRHKRITPEQREKQYIQTKSNWLLQRGQVTQAMELLGAAVAKYPDDPALALLRHTTLIGTSDALVARNYFVNRLVQHATADAHRAQILNCLAWNELCLGDAGSLHDAELWITEARKLLPWDAAIQSTAGWLLVVQNQLEEGMASLKSALQGIDPACHHATILSTMALADSRAGNFARARERLRIAIRLDPPNEHARRIESLLSAASKAEARVELTARSNSAA
jgi:Tfp pilus assembly protein PilF